MPLAQLGDAIRLTVMEGIMETSGIARHVASCSLTVWRWGDGRTLELVMSRGSDARGGIRIALTPDEARRLVSALGRALEGE